MRKENTPDPGTDMETAISVRNLTQRYGAHIAVDGISFDVRKGEVFGLLGPNGAGKSTTLAVLQALRPPDEGRVTILGMEARSHATEIRSRVGVQLQRSNWIPGLTALRQLQLMASLYGIALSAAALRELLQRVGLSNKADTTPARMSGGEQQRLALALALVHSPEIVFLDEPTAGLDPRSRRTLWDLVSRLRCEGRTVVLTTHYLEEAEALCGRVGIMDRGRLLAVDEPGALKGGPGGRTTLEDVYLRLTSGAPDTIYERSR